MELCSFARCCMIVRHRILFVVVLHGCHSHGCFGNRSCLQVIADRELRPGYRRLLVAVELLSCLQSIVDRELRPGCRRLLDASELVPSSYVAIAARNLSWLRGFAAMLVLFELFCWHSIGSFPGIEAVAWLLMSESFLSCMYERSFVFILAIFEVLTCCIPKF